MKKLVRTHGDLVEEERWDIDYHSPPEKIKRYPESRRIKVSKLATVSKQKRKPRDKPEEKFRYIDISSVNVKTGVIEEAQELIGEEAPSRARMVVRAYDVIVSTVRPTRGAIAVIPEELDNEICSTGFCVLRPKRETNPYYLHCVLKLDSTAEQFRKFSTGTSYPAILDGDVLKTIVPGASKEEQDAISLTVRSAYEERKRLLEKAERKFQGAMDTTRTFLAEPSATVSDLEVPDTDGLSRLSIDQISEARQSLNISDATLL